MIYVMFVIPYIFYITCYHVFITFRASGQAAAQPSQDVEEMVDSELLSCGLAPIDLDIT